MKNHIEDLRNHLFLAIEKLHDDEQPMDIDRAKAISDVAQTLINSAKVEVQFLEVVPSAMPTSFMQERQRLLPTEDSRKS